MLTPTVIAGLVMICCLLRAFPAAAQETFDELTAKVKPGQKIIVLDQQGTMTQGGVEQISSSTLVVNYFRGRIQDPSLATTRTFRPADVRRVQKPGHLWDGAIKGAAVGLIPALINIGIDCYDCMEAEFTALCVTVGAAAGVGIDALFGPKTIYRRQSAARVAFAPVMSRHARGVAVSFRF